MYLFWCEVTKIWFFVTRCSPNYMHVSQPGGFEWCVARPHLLGPVQLLAPNSEEKCNKSCTGLYFHPFWFPEGTTYVVTRWWPVKTTVDSRIPMSTVILISTPSSDLYSIWSRLHSLTHFCSRLVCVLAHRGLRHSGLLSICW